VVGLCAPAVGQGRNARAFYEAEALRGGWSVRQLDRQIGSQFYERTALSKNKAAMLEKGQPRPATPSRPTRRSKTPTCWSSSTSRTSIPNPIWKTR
jgi:predicted nuclease of restriction endonuclease-like (RecB) superfamily